MKVARYYAPGDIRLEDSPEPFAGPGELKIRVRNCSVCGTDVRISRFGHDRIVPPRVMGHEVAGEVVETGAGVRGWETGDRVQVAPIIPCGTCQDCRRRGMNLCPGKTTISYDCDGGFSRYMIVPAPALAVGGVNRIPGQLSFAEASLAEPLACVLNGQELARVGEGDDVVVIGAGPIGCLHVRLARARGAARVLMVNVSAARLGRAASLVQPDAAICCDDADVLGAVRELTGGLGADVFILAAAAVAAHEQAIAMAARRGRISFFSGLPQGSPLIAFDSNVIHYRELTIVGASGSSPAQNAAALELIASGQVPVRDLITHRLSLDEIAAALDTVARGEGIKVTIEP
jgi:L-iditol 2-dehydrogenase